MDIDSKIGIPFDIYRYFAFQWISKDLCGYLRTFTWSTIFRTSLRRRLRAAPPGAHLVKVGRFKRVRTHISMCNEYSQFYGSSNLYRFIISLGMHLTILFFLRRVREACTTQEHVWLTGLAPSSLFQDVFNDSCRLQSPGPALNATMGHAPWAIAGTARMSKNYSGRKPKHFDSVHWFM